MMYGERHRGSGMGRALII